jgi:polyhydroxybutyrate depolymerase
VASDGRRQPRSLALRIACALVTIALAGCGSASQGTASAGAGAGQSKLAPGAKRFTLRTADGRVRSYIVYLPPGAAKRRPLVLVFHGAGGTADATMQETDFVQAAAKDGFVVAFLQGFQDTWNEGAGDTPAHAAGVDDVQFTSAVLAQIERSYSIDRGRVAATGFSNGALLTELLGCRLAASLTLVAPVAGPLPVSVSPGCQPARAISVLEMHGTADRSIPYEGGRFYGIGGGTTVLSAPASAARWAALDHCGQQRQSTDAAESTVLTTYSACAEHVLVQLRTLEGAGHGWPPNVGTLIATFLRQHPRAR